MDQDRKALERNSVELRAELKIWEKQFQADNGGRKAGRDDIKANPTIAAKYKEFQKVRDVLLGKNVTQKSPKMQKRPRPATKLSESLSKQPRSVHNTPQKKLFQVPAPQDEDQDLNTPAIKRTMIGPTPQKDGIVLGIFDIFPAATPSKTRSVLTEMQPNVAVTPSKPTDKVLESPLYEERARGSRTPASTGKRFLLDSFVTPRKRKMEEEGTPSSSFKQFATPAFLKRDNFVISTIDEVPPTPQAAQPWKRRSFGRSLSGMIKDMRKDQEKQVEQQADDDLDLLREMEEEADPRPRPEKPVPSIIVEEIQAPEVLHSQIVVVLDRDGFVPSDIEQSESEKDQPGMPVRKPWKKKGLKRTTRRVIMRPVAKKAGQPQTQTQPEEESEEEADAVAETQVQDDVPSDIERDGSEYDTDHEAAPKSPKKSKKSNKSKKSEAKEATTEELKTNRRKTKATANANYRALKIKSKNSKGKGGGRFGRRR